MMHFYHHYCPIILFIIILLLKSFISTQIPVMIYNLADETPAGSLIGNIAENLSSSYIRNYTYLFITSMKFQYIYDYIKITSNGDIITVHHSDRDNTNDICGPLNCCPLLVCQIEANIILTKQWNTHWKHDLDQVNYSFMKNDRITDKDEEKLRRNSIKLNESNEQQTMIHLNIRIIDANDNPPRDTNGFEGLPIASDPDSELNGIVMYKLIEYTNNGDLVKEPRLNITMTYDHIHSINPKLILLRSLDYENIDDREIYATFYAIDGGDPSITCSLSIIIRLLDMNDNHPIIMKQSTMVEQYILLPENTTLDNKPFYIVNATDADSGEKSRLIYSFSPLANSLIPIKFHIDSINGAITIREPLDYEVYSERQFLLPIVVKDSGSPPLSCTTSISIQIKDNNDNIPTIMIQENITIPEGQLFTKPIIRFYIKDEILCKPTSLESTHLQDKELLAGQDYLSLHPVSDTVFFIFTKGIFDYEQIQYASLLIDCYDLADIEPFKKVNFTLQHFHEKDLLKHPYRFRITAAISDQNDNIPIFKQSKYYIKIPEHISDGAYITEMKAYDLDKGEYGQLTYQLKSITFNYIGDHDHDHDEEDPDHLKYSRHPQEYEQPFEIHPLNGIITVLHNHLLDREQIEYFNLTILAIDKGNLTTHTQFIIQLIDINDHLPILYNNNHINIDFQENQKINTFIGYDPDHGLNGTILYQLNLLTNGSQYFYLNESNSKLYTNWFMDSAYESTLINMDTNPSYDPPIEGIYHIKISLKDMGIPSLVSNEIQVFIKIHSFNPSIINNQSIIHSNQKTMTFWLSNHHPHHQNQFLWILLVITMILLIIIISSIVIWIQSYCKQKFNHHIIKTECNPMIITTTTTTTTKNHHQSLKKPYLISCLSTNKKYQYSSIIINHNNQSIWPDTNIIHQSINDQLNVNTTSSNTTHTDPFHYTNHLHTIPICSSPFWYNTSNHSNNNNTNDYYYHNNNQLIGQKYTSLNTSNLSTHHLNSSMNATLTNDHRNLDIYHEEKMEIGNSAIRLNDL
uniref:Protocadherin-11 X-linked n=1 Tax=Schistosoma haematobium TaxID=6185 RepID=A0A094ZWK8_SCHHA